MPPKKKDAEEKKILLGRPKGNLRMGLVGLPNVGKSSTFNLLSKQAVAAENYPFCTTDPHEARMSVPDERFESLCEMYHPRSKVPATLTIFDIAGLVPGAHQGEGLGNAFLSHIQAVDGIYHVVRAFDNTDIIHTEGEVHPINDLETISNELRMKDVERCKSRVEEMRRVVNRGQDKTKQAELATMEIVLKHLEEDKKWISMGDWSIKDVEFLNEYQFLTAKPVVYLVNLSESDFINQKNKWLAKIHGWVQANIPGPIIPYSAEFEQKVAEFSTEEEKQKFILDSKAKASMIPKIIKTGYTTLSLVHFFTSGEDEVRCWTIREGTKAPQAAGQIHTDMEKGFICADVTKYTDLMEAGDEVACKTAGKVRQKGKEYVVEDGDIVFFKFNPTGGGKK